MDGNFGNVVFGHVSVAKVTIRELEKRLRLSQPFMDALYMLL